MCGTACIRNFDLVCVFKVSHIALPIRMLKTKVFYIFSLCISFCWSWSNELCINDCINCVNPDRPGPVCGSDGKPPYVTYKGEQFLKVLFLNSFVLIGIPVIVSNF